MGILPDNYRKLEYIESTGTQYINTGFKSKKCKCNINLVTNSLKPLQCKGFNMLIFCNSIKKG